MKRMLMELVWGDLRNVEWNLNETDDVAVRYAAYHLQQATEKMVKACLKELGISYVKTHRITDLLNRLPDKQDLLSDSMIEWLEIYSPTLYDWESKSRYVEDYIISRRQVERLKIKVFEFYKELKTKFDEIDKIIEKEKPKMPDEIIYGFTINNNLNENKVIKNMELE